MRKIGIITLNGNFNYGNRLQNYALLKYIQKLGFSVETIWLCNYKSYIKEKLKRIIYTFNYRKKSFLEFTDSNLKVNYCINKNKLNKYDKFIVGSDQVWNYSFPDFNSSFFLDFSEYEKNVSYAASFGVDKIPQKYEKEYIRGLNNIKYISVRENAGYRIVKELISKECEVSIDPTLLLNSKEWDSIIKKPKKYNDKKYIFCYFLGNISEHIKNEIYKYAKDNDLDIINLLDKNDKYYSSGPQEFLWFEKNASLICTDSFHSSVFGLIYDKPFIIFERDDNEKNMYSRIETLLSKFQIKNRKFNGTNITKENIEHDYTDAYSILEIERKKSDDYLKRALDIK